MDKCCAKVIRNHAYLVELGIAIISRQYIGQVTTERGWHEVLAHERRHGQVYLNAAEAYYAPIAGTARAALRCGTVCDKNGAEAAAEKLRQYLSDIDWRAAWPQFDRYVLQETSRLDGGEVWVMDRNGLFDYLTNIREPRQPPPFDEASLPECPESSNCNE